MYDWDDLRVFLAVARTGSVRAAAKHMGKTHATMSRRVRSLEVALGGRLFERQREGQCLTGLGERILPLAETAEKDMAAIDRVAFSGETGLAGPVKLSLSESLYLALMNKPIDAFMVQYPMIVLEIAASDKMSSLAYREADVVIRITRTPPESAVGRKLADSPMAVFASQSYLADRPKVDRWVTQDYESASKPLLPGRIVAHASTPAVAVDLARSGRGMTLLACYMGDTDPLLVRVPGLEPIPDMQIWVLTHGDVRGNPRIRVLMEWLYRAFEDCRPIIEGKTGSAVRD